MGRSRSEAFFDCKRPQVPIVFAGLFDHGFPRWSERSDQRNPRLPLIVTEG